MVTRIWSMMCKQKPRKQSLLNLEERGELDRTALFNYLMEFIEKMEPKSAQKSTVVGQEVTVTN